jgi:hypothetical protein
VGALAAFGAAVVGDVGIQNSNDGVTVQRDPEWRCGDFVDGAMPSMTAGSRVAAT